jgi:hypothetical protein
MPVVSRYRLFLQGIARHASSHERRIIILIYLLLTACSNAWDSAPQLGEKTKTVSACSGGTMDAPAFNATGNRQQATGNRQQATGKEIILAIA